MVFFGFFLVFRLFGAWCSVLGAWFLGLGAFIGSFFAGDKYLRLGALDSNCIYSFDFYCPPALQGRLRDCWNIYIYLCACVLGMNKGVLLIHDCNDTKSYWERYMYNPKMIDKQSQDMPISQCMSANDKTLPYTKVREKITYN